MNTSYFHPRCLSSSPDLSESKTFAYFYIKVYSFESGYKNILIRALVKVVDWISPILTICSHLEELIFLCSLLCGVFSISFCQAISFIYKCCCTLRISEQGRIAGVIYKKEGYRNEVLQFPSKSSVAWYFGLCSKILSVFSILWSNSKDATGFICQISSLSHDYFGEDKF